MTQAKESFMNCRQLSIKITKFKSLSMYWHQYCLWEVNPVKYSFSVNVCVYEPALTLLFNLHPTHQFNSYWWVK